MNLATLPKHRADADRRFGLRLAVVEAAGRNGALTSLLASQDDVVALRVGSVAELLDLAAGEQLDAVMLDPELPEGWPMAVAERVVDGLDGRLPLVIACRSPADAKAIGDRLGASLVFVVLREQLKPRAVLQLLAGAAAIIPAESL